MQKLLKFLFLLNISLLNSYAANLELEDTSDPIFNLRDNAGAQLNQLYAISSGDGKTLEAAVKIYAPMGLASGATDTNYYLDMTSRDLPQAGSVLGGIELTHVKLTGHASEQIYVALLNNDSSSPAYHVVKQVSSLQAPFISYEQLCLTDQLDCAAITDSTASIKSKLELVVFIAASDADYSDNQEVEIPDTVGQALFFNLVLSGASTAVAGQLITPTAQYDGDSMGVIEYTGDFGSNSQYISRIASYVKETTNPAKTDFAAILEGIEEEGSVTIRNLENNKTYRASLAYLDHFGFASTPISTPFGDMNPRPIEALLAANQCYFVTAGFQRDHYVLNYFRYIRDEFLLKTTVGKAFVDFYYGSAPQYVGYILNNKSLAHRVKSYSFSTYFVLQNIVSIIGCMLILAVFNHLRRQRREQFYAL